MADEVDPNTMANLSSGLELSLQPEIDFRGDLAIRPFLAFSATVNRTALLKYLLY